MLIYISHPYGGKEENKAKVEQIIKKLTKTDPKHTYISPIHTFGFLYHDVDYETGLIMCLNLLSGCDKIYVYGDYKSSAGCMAEIECAKEMQIPYKIMR